MNLGILKAVLPDTWEITKYTDLLKCSVVKLTGRECLICMKAYSELRTKMLVPCHLVGTAAIVPVVLRRGQREERQGDVPSALQ